MLSRVIYRRLFCITINFFNSTWMIVSPDVLASNFRAHVSTIPFGLFLIASGKSSLEKLRGCRDHLLNSPQFTSEWKQESPSFISLLLLAFGLSLEGDRCLQTIAFWFLRVTFLHIDYDFKFILHSTLFLCLLALSSNYYYYPGLFQQQPMMFEAWNLYSNYSFYF